MYLSYFLKSLYAHWLNPWSMPRPWPQQLPVCLKGQETWRNMNNLILWNRSWDHDNFNYLFYPVFPLHMFLAYTPHFLQPPEPHKCGKYFTLDPIVHVLLDALPLARGVHVSSAGTYHSGLVTTVSTTVPGGGFLSPPPISAKNLAPTRFFTTITVSLGLKDRKRKKQYSPGKLH